MLARNNNLMLDIINLSNLTIFQHIPYDFVILTPYKIKTYLNQIFLINSYSVTKKGGIK